MKNTIHPVGSYFDNIAADYAKRYETARPYHHYLFVERLKLSAQHLDFQQRSILDIGAGTGGLYDYIAAKTNQFDYLATDVSPEMLAQSNIPETQRMVGKIAELTLPKQSFDYIFILGVSTYLPPDELTETIHIAAKLLAPNGQLIVTYTNLCGLDWAVRRLLRKLWRGRGVIGQNFETYAYNPNKIALPDGLDPNLSLWYNATLTPFNTCFPKSSVWLARQIDKYAPNHWKPTLCGDVICTYS